MLSAMTMKSFCSVFAAVVPMLLVACSPTDAEAGQTLSPEISKAVLDWSTCRSSKVGALLPSQRGAEEIVDQAFSECARFEAEQFGSGKWYMAKARPTRSRRYVNVGVSG